MQCFSLTQIVPSFTHVSPCGNKSLIDLALLSDASKVSQCQTISPLSNSDHFGIELVLKMNTTGTSRQSKKRTVWLYEQADFEKANRLISATNWNELLCDDVEASVRYWQCKVLAIMHECIPTKTLPKRRHPPWLSGSIVKHIRKRNALFQKPKGIITPCTISLHKK